MYAIEMKAILHPGTTSEYEVAFSASFSIGMGELTSLNQFDTNKNKKIDDSEFFSVIDLWVTSTIRDELFFAVIDAWVSQKSLKASTTPSRKPVAPAIRFNKGSITFTARGLSAAQLRVDVFDLRSRRIFTQESLEGQLMWNLRAQDDQPIANGVYLYVVTVRGADGRELSSAVKKLIVLK